MIAVMRARRSVLLLLWAFICSGCVTTKLSDSVATAIKIDQRCTAVFEAMPAEGTRTLEDELLNSISIRVTGACAKSTGRCKADDDAHGLLYGVVSAQKALKTDIENAEAKAKTAKTKLGEKREKLTGVAIQVLDDLNELSNAARVLEGRPASFRKSAEAGLKSVRGMFVTKFATYQNFECRRRSDCARELSQRVTDLETEVRGALIALRSQSVRFGSAITRDVALIKNASGRLRDRLTAQDAGALPREELLAAADAYLDALDSAAVLTSSVEALGSGVVGSLNSFGNLVAADIDSASVDFLAAKLYGRAAERTLILIEKMLLPVDKLVDKLDDKFYVAASATTTLFSADIQKQFDHIYEKVVIPVYPTATMKLAFAGAACQRLYGDHAEFTKYPSLFMPFVLAMFTNVQVDIDNGRVTRKDRHALLDLARKDNEGTEPDEPAKFEEMVVRAQTKDLADGRSLALSEQVATCMSADYSSRESMIKTGNSETDIKKIANETCGRALLGASAMAAQPANLAGADGPLVPKVPSRSVVNQIAGETMAVRLAIVPDVLEKDVRLNINTSVIGNPTSPPVPPANTIGFCAKLAQRVGTAHCDEDGAGFDIEFESTFASRAFTDTKLEKSLVALSQLLRREGRRLTVTVVGHSSSAPVRCSTTVDSLCSGIERSRDKGNSRLAVKRAEWAKAVIQSRAGDGVTVSVIGVGTKNALPGNSSLDRRLTLRIEPSG